MMKFRQAALPGMNADGVVPVGAAYDRSGEAPLPGTPGSDPEADERWKRLNALMGGGYGSPAYPEPTRRFQGETFDAALDGPRLTRQYDRVFAALARDRERWWTLAELAAEAGGSEAGVSARLRDARKAPNGGHTVERRRRGDGRRGVHEYRLCPPKPKEEQA